MANIRWSGIESFKYGLTARWFVSAFYGNDIDVDGAGYYNPTTNVTGHGGPTRPFATLSKLNQDTNIVVSSVCVLDSGYYVSNTTKSLQLVGDGIVSIQGTVAGSNSQTNKCCNIRYIQSVVGPGSSIDCVYIYSIKNENACEGTRNIYIESSIGGTSAYSKGFYNCIFYRLSAGCTLEGTGMHNCLILLCESATWQFVTPRPAGRVCDYSILIGSIKNTTPINGKTTGVTVEDFKINGNYFIKSFSEVDLFGNVSGSGASVAQLQTIFNNYFSPIYIDTWQDVDLSLKPTASDIVKFGGLNGTYIGALPVGYRFSASSLYNTYVDAVNSSNLAWDAVNSSIVIADGFDTAVYRSIRISLSQPIIVDPINFFANLVYNSEGTARQGVANQRIDTTPDLGPNNTLNQRVVYDYKLAYSPNNVDALSAFKNFELNNVPYVDNEGESMLDDNYDSSERQRITVQDFMIEFTLRKIVIE